MKFDNFSEAIQHARTLFEDISFSYASNWKKQNSTRHIIGFLPIYIPREIIHSANMLPVGIFGAGDRIPVVHGDAYFQSYICHLPRTVIELAKSGHLNDFDGFIFPAICDVIRNLSGIFMLDNKQKFIRYLDYPQNFEGNVGGKFYRQELNRLSTDLEKLNGKKVITNELNHSISIYNEQRRLLKLLGDFRSEFPHKLSAVDYYLIQRTAHTMCVEDFNPYLENIFLLLDKLDVEPEDKIRVIISGSFCEQPPIGLIKTIENAGCYIVEDDLQLNLNWITKEIPTDTDDPIGALVDAYINHSIFSSTVYEGDKPKGDQLAEQVKDRKADGVVFCAPSFCDPALLDRPQLEKAMDKHHIRHFSFQYHENLGQFHVIKEQAGTFADTIKLWE
ncbi:MAG: 2-hydroxyacyl-CoA dehydratase [Candidatus Marinimicrobia bacterium]|nr:2-hydroxyacyl-CoA dehydratase [Candidatus Neomarinimicrobiota bacterium]